MTPRPLDGPEFAELVRALGPLPERPKLVVGVSGGADSTALALLGRDWARSLGGEIHAILVDHGLRPAARLEARATQARLAALGIPLVVLRLRGVKGGAAIERRARDARYGLLWAACADLGAVLLLLGHQALDQAETVLLRAQGGSGVTGLAAMAGRREVGRVAMLRPLLAIPPERLWATLAERRVGWVEDLSNRASTFQRPRLRAASADRAGVGCASRALVAASRAYAKKRTEGDAARNRALAANLAFYPEGFATLLPGPLPCAVLAALLRALSGSIFALSEARLRAFAERPHPATLGGVRFLPAGRLGPGLLAVREAQAMAAPVPALPGARWDGRFRLSVSALPPGGATLGPLGRAAKDLRSFSPLPAVVLVTLPALRVGEKLVAVPHLGYPDRATCQGSRVVFAPAEPMGAVAPLYEEGNGGA